MRHICGVRVTLQEQDLGVWECMAGFGDSPPLTQNIDLSHRHVSSNSRSAGGGIDYMVVREHNGVDTVVSNEEPGTTTQDVNRLMEESESKPESRATNTIQYHPTNRGLKLEPYNPHNPNHRHAKKFVEIGTSAADQFLQNQYLNRINRGPAPANQHYRMLPLNTAKPRIHGPGRLAQQRPWQVRLLPPNPF